MCVLYISFVKDCTHIYIVPTGPIVTNTLTFVFSTMCMLGIDNAKLMCQCNLLSLHCNSLFLQKNVLYLNIL